MLLPEVKLDAHGALAELQGLLRESSANLSPPRLWAVRYQICRSTLMSGELKAYLPGYIFQCVSLFKFREFIHLYDHEVGSRIAFVDRSFENCWTQLNERPTFGTFRDNDF
jgi:hypothetical protein